MAKECLAVTIDMHIYRYVDCIAIGCKNSRLVRNYLRWTGPGLDPAAATVPVRLFRLSLDGRRPDPANRTITYSWRGPAHQRFKIFRPARPISLVSETPSPGLYTSRPTITDWPACVSDRPDHGMANVLSHSERSGMCAPKLAFQFLFLSSVCTPRSRCFYPTKSCSRGTHALYPHHFSTSTA